MNLTDGDKLKLLYGYPLTFKDVCLVYSPVMNEIAATGLEDFYQSVSILLTTKPVGEEKEIAELKEASLTKTKDEIEKELGDVLFSVVNLARHLDVDPNLALASTNQKFMKRFAYVEEKMELSGEQMNPENLEIMDKFWDESKKLGF